MILWVYPDEAMPSPGTLCALVVKRNGNNLLARLGLFDGENWNSHPFNGSHYRREDVIVWSEFNGPRLREGTHEGNNN